MMHDSKDVLHLFDETFRRQGFQRVGGIDEVGRGPFAGPVVAALCVFRKGFLIEGLFDSKSLTERQRGLFYKSLMNSPFLDFSLGIVSVSLIDEIGVHKASLLAMQRAYDAIREKPDCLLVDGREAPTFSEDNPSVHKIVQGDQKSALIAAASIIAKVRRDWIMREVDQLFPEYFFKDHKGYGTEKHRAALKNYGPISSVHRISFAPIKELLLS